MKKKIVLYFIIGCVILFFVSLVLISFVFPRKYKNHVVAFSEEYGLDKALVYAIIKVESDFNKTAISKSGALGLMQILPNTAKWIAKELNQEYNNEIMFEPEINIKFGCFYLRYLFDKFDDIDKVICAYNAGEGKVFDWIENGELVRDKIDYNETKNYLSRVEGYFRIYKNKLIYR